MDKITISQPKVEINSVRWDNGVPFPVPVKCEQKGNSIYFQLDDYQIALAQYFGIKISYTQENSLNG